MAFLGAGAFMSKARFLRRALPTGAGVFLVVTILIAFQASNAKAVTFNWHLRGAFTYVGPGNDDVQVNDTIVGGGTLTANFVTGVQYLVNSITGALYLNGDPNLSIPVTGLISVGSFQGNDNQLFFPSSVSQPHLNLNGLGATTGSVQSNDLTNIVMYFLATSSGSADGNSKDCGVAGYCIYVQKPGSNPILISLSSFEVSQTPLPAALPLFATGLGALGLIGWRRKRKQAA